jgi:hypothetical protein
VLFRNHVVAIYLADKLVFRMAVALGGGEGAHPYFGIANFLLAWVLSPQRGRRTRRPYGARRLGTAFTVQE